MMPMINIWVERLYIQNLVVEEQGKFEGDGMYMVCDVFSVSSRVKSLIHGLTIR